MAKFGRVRCGRWDSRLGARCGRVLRDVVPVGTERMGKSEHAQYVDAQRNFSGAWWEVTRPVAQAGERDRDTGRIDIRAGQPWWVAVCRCGEHYAVPADELRTRTIDARDRREDLYLTAEDRDTPGMVN